MTDPTGPGPTPDESPLLHQFKNHLSVVVGFCDLLLRDLPEDDPRRADILEIRGAALAAMRLLPELAERMR